MMSWDDDDDVHVVLLYVVFVHFVFVHFVFVHFVFVHFVFVLLHFVFLPLCACSFCVCACVVGRHRAFQMSISRVASTCDDKGAEQRILGRLWKLCAAEEWRQVYVLPYRDHQPSMSWGCWGWCCVIESNIYMMRMLMMTIMMTLPQNDSLLTLSLFLYFDPFLAYIPIFCQIVETIEP